MLKFKSFIYLTFSLFVVSFTSSCVDPISCTEEFRSVSVEVIGGPLDNYYTLRIENGDTLQFGTSILPYYPVLDDSFQPPLEGKQEEFQFIGALGDSIVVSEIYLISADECHINKVSGVASVTL